MTYVLYEHMRVLIPILCCVALWVLIANKKGIDSEYIQMFTLRFHSNNKINIDFATKLDFTFSYEQN